MKSKILSICLVFFGAFVIVFMLILTNQKETKKNELIFKPVDLIGHLVLQKKEKVDKRYSNMKLINSSLFFNSWDEGFRGKLFQFNRYNLKLEKELLFNEENPNYKIDNFFFLKDSIVVLNNQSHELLTYDYNLKVRNTLKFSDYPSRIAIKNDKIIYSAWDDDFNLYYRHIKNYKISQNLTINSPFIKKYGAGIIYDGYFFQNRKFTVALPYAANEVIIFDEKLEYQKNVKLRYNDLNFKFVKASNGSTFISPNNLNPNLYAFLDNSNKLFILMTEKSQFNILSKSFIDIYNIETNNYLGSYSVPLIDSETPQYFVIDKNVIYVLYESYIASYIIRK